MLNREQNIALESEGHSCLVANAGSGKTTILSHKYIYLLENDRSVNHDPARIVALTFTNAAAAQMKRKIIKEIENKIYNEKNRDKLKILYKIRNGMDSARISTIHSFCSSLMLENASNADLFFSNFDNDSSSHSRALLQITRSYLAESLQNQASKSNLLPLIHRFGIEFIENYIIKIIDDQEKLFKLSEFYSNDFHSVSELIYNDLLDLFKSSFEEFTGTCRELFDSLPPQKPSDVANYTNAFRNLDDIRIKINTARKPKNFFESLDISKIIKMKAGRSFIQNKLSKEFPKVKEQLNALATSMEEIYKSFQNAGNDELVFGAGKEIFLMAININKEFESYKKYNNLIDFNDMISYSKKLLEDDRLRNEIVSGASVMMIDEFQDTSPLQFEILRNFILKDNSTKLFIVGDPKQSIYGFRNADVRIFYSAKQLLKSINKSNILNAQANSSLSPEETLGMIELPTSYRFSRKIASWLNHIFSNLMGLNKSEYDVGYEDIVCGLDSEGDGDTAIEFLLSIVDSNRDEDDNEKITQSEYDLIAARIKNLLIRGTNPSEIAILIRSKTHIESIFAGLRASGIEFEFSGKSSLLEKQEIKDIIFLLTFLQNPLDNENFSCLLKSYFFYFSDQLILDISLHKNYSDEKSLWEKMQSLSKNSSDSRLGTACKLLQYLSDATLVLSISELIDRAIDGSSWRENTKNLELNENLLHESIENFKEFLISNSSSISSNVYEFLSWLNSLKDTKTEIEFASEPSNSKIKIMTIHSAKGLEFEHVFLLGINNSKGGNKSGNTMLSDKAGLVFNWDIFLGEGKQEIESTFSYYGKTKNKQLELAEEKRLLYVAMSRAKKNLYLVAKVKTKKDGYTINQNQYLDFILKSLDMTIIELVDCQENGGFEIKADIGVIKENRKVTKTCTQKIKVITDVEPTGNVIPHSRVQHNTQAEITLSQPIISKIKDEYFSASKFTNFLSDREEYTRKYILGLPDEKDEKFFGLTHNSESKKEEVIGTLKGNIQHGALEHLRQWMDASGEIDGEKLAEIVRKQFQIYEHLPGEELMESTIEILLNCAATETITRNIKNIHNSIAEYSLRMPYGEDFLLANIDLLLEKENGELEIWDWKSNRVRDINHAKETAQKYKLQMMVYAYFASLVNDKQEDFKTLLLFTRLAGHGKKDDDWTVEFSFSRDELKEFTRQVNDYIRDIKELLYL